MSCINSNILAGASGSAGGEPVYVDDVFSTFVYTGTSAAHTINNGIELGSNVGVSLNGKTITDTTGGGANYTQLIDDIFSSANSNYYYGSIDCYIDYGSAVVSTFYDLAPQGDNSIGAVYNTPTSITGYGSNNASSWTSLGAVSFVTADWAEGNFTRYNFSNTTAYRYYRLTVSGTKALQEWRLGISDPSLGQGGLVWVKCRTAAENNILVDTERGVSGYALISNSSAGTYATTNTVTAFNSNGFTVGPNGATGSNNEDYVAWSFRKAPGFFDVVTYTDGGGGSATIPHSLGSVPGAILVKSLSSGAWQFYHKDMHPSSPQNYAMQLNETSPRGSISVWNNTAPTSTHFSVGNNLYENGNNYVAYLFADSEASFGTDEDESIIKCGTYTASGSLGSVNLGFEPQFVLVKSASGAGAWFLFDSMRGMPVGSNDPYLRPDVNYAENPNGNYIELTSTGFNIQNLGSTEQFIYMAIRRPNKPPEAATEVFAMDTRGGTSPTPPSFYSGFPVDFSLHRNIGNDGWNTSARLMGQKYVATSNNLQEETMPNALKILLNYDDSEGMGTQTVTSSDEYNWMFKRAPGFMDVVTFSGTGSNLAVNHNLDAIPELILHKNRTSSTNWIVSTTPLYSSGKILNLSSNGGPFGGGTSFMTSTPTASQISLSSSSSTVNASGNNYIQYLFATLPGISKVGSYSGNTGYAVNVNCGFTNGARFIMIKRIDEDVTGDWYVWDTLRGIASGNDPYLLLNSSNGQISNTDYIDPLGAGFTVTSSAPAALNTSGGTYIFLAIA